jgi:hypothetical protein
MKPSRTTRLVAVVLAVISLLFTQLALAAYACPEAVQDRAPMTKVARAMPAMDNCAGMDMAQPSLCDAHRHPGHQSLDKPPAPQVPPFLATGLGLVVHAVVPVAPAAFPVHSRVLLARATAPPLAIRHCCFRI